MTTESENKIAPPVTPADLLAVWNLVRKLRADHSPEHPSLTLPHTALQKSCSPGADLEAISVRTLMLDILTQVSPAWMDKPSAAKVVEVAARFPINPPQPGPKSDTPPFDVREFMKQIAAR